MKAKVDFGMIVLNGDSFVDLVIKNVYDIANKIIIIEGAVKSADMTYKNFGRCSSSDENGLSVDKTQEKILSVPDPLKKIVYKRVGWVSDKVKLSQMYLDESDADYMWQLDSDEMYEEWVMNEVIEYLEAYKDVNTVSFPLRHFIGDICHIGSGSKNTAWSTIPFRRIHRFKKGSAWKHHEPPELIWPDRKDTTVDKIGTELSTEFCMSMGWYLYHYSLVERKQAVEKMENFYSRIYKPNWVKRIFDHIFDKDIIDKYGSHPRCETNIWGEHITLDKGNVEKFIRRHPKGIKEHQCYKDVYPPNKDGSKQLNVIHLVSMWCGGGGCRSPYVLAKLVNRLYGGTHEFVILSTIGPDEDFAGRSIYTFMGANDDKIVNYVKKCKPDIVHIHWWTADSERYRKIRERLSEFPSVITIHSHPEGAPWGFDSKDVGCNNAVILSSEKLLETSKMIKELSIPKYVVYSSYDITRFTDKEKIAHYGFNIIVYGYKCIGRYREGMFVLCKKIIDKYENVSINFVSLNAKDSEYGKECASYGSDRMIYRGMIDVPDLMQTMDMVLHLLPDRCFSTSEVFLQEASLMKIPVLRIGGYNSVTDQLVCENVKTEEELMIAFDKLYNDKNYRDDLVKRAHDRVTNTLDPLKAAQSVRKIYLETIEGFKK